MGEPLQADELALFQKLTERQHPPAQRVSEFVGVIGRRGGKSRAIATLLVYLATLVNYKPRLASGETGVALCIAPSQDQAQIVLDYASGILEASPILRQLIRRQTSETIELTNGITIDVRSASFRRLRGLTCITCIADEAAFWHSDESANPDAEILGAVRPSLATTHGLLCVISSPYARRGVVWDAFRNHFGPTGNPSILVARGTTRDLNPSLSQAYIDREYEKDPASAAAEYGAEFRTDVESFVTAESLEDCIDPGIHERPYDRAHIYTAFADPSGGAFDSFTLAITHKEGKTAVLDVIREVRPPFAPEGVVEQFCQVLRNYRIYTVRSDKYGGEWVVEQFRKCGVTLEACDKTKSQLYADFLPIINSRQCALLDDQVLRRQLIALERKTRMGGKDVIDHVRGGRDDVANAVAGALVYAGQSFSDPNFYKPINYPKLGIV
jgi:phage terminase large subunit-like protein